jgi:small subunit ribosomal protein S8
LRRLEGMREWPEWSMTDPIADLLTRIRNAVQAKHDSLVVPRSKIKLAILRILKEEGFLAGFVEVEDEKNGLIKVFPRYDEATSQGVIRGLKRVSKPSRRYYVRKDQIPRVRNGLGLAILTTPQGVLSDGEARSRGLGGEVICYVW